MSTNIVSAVTHRTDQNSKSPQVKPDRSRQIGRTDPKMSNSDPRLEDIYARALRAFNCYRGDPIEIIDEALTSSPDFIMGHILRVHVHISLWERSVLPEIGKMLKRLTMLFPKANDREQRHIIALNQWAEGNWDKARTTLDYLSADYPRDLLALQAGHLSDFFHGDRESLRGRIARALPHWTVEDRGYGFLLGLYAFGLEECAAYQHAEEIGHRALDINKDDCWAQHAIAHVMEMQCRQSEGIAFMLSRKAHWSQDDSAFKFHNWWHTALFHLDQGEPHQALKIYDEGIRPEPSDLQMTMLDAVAMLWRMHLQGFDVGERWDELANLYDADSEAGFYVFNDMHAMMALVATGREKSSDARLASVEAATNSSNTNARMTKEVGLNIVRAVHAFGQRRYHDVVELLMPVRHRAFVFGGSHAQRDIVHRTLIEAARRANSAALYEALVYERDAQRPNCPFTWRLKDRVGA